jgi:dTDP-glucose 4,6-dehydratase
MNILVTGGAGFIGSNFIRYMLSKYSDYFIVNLDKLTYAGNLDNLKEVENSLDYTFIRGNIGNRELVANIVDMYNVDAIVNFAAESHVDRSIMDPEVFTLTNVLGTQVLLDVAKEHKVKRFVQISTDEVYGSLGETGLFTEQTPIAPNSPYSASKASADLFVQAYHETYGLHTNITRCSNNYGPFHYPEKLIPLMITNALEDKKLPVYGDGLNVRDWLHVSDHAAAIDLVLHQGEAGEVYNIGGNNEHPNVEIVELILEELGKSKSLVHFVQDRLGHDRRYAIDASKIRKLGWVPQISFQQGIKDTIEWYLENSQWWQDIKDRAYSRS